MPLRRRLASVFNVCVPWVEIVFVLHQPVCAELDSSQCAMAVHCRFGGALHCCSSRQVSTGHYLRNGEITNGSSPLEWLELTLTRHTYHNLPLLSELGI